MVGKNRLTGLLIVWALLAAATAPASAQILGDDFNDLNDDGWTHSRTGEGETWGPGRFDAGSGAYNLTTTGLIPSQGLGVISTFWDVSADPFYNNGLWRATVRAESRGTNLGFLLRSGNAPGGYLVTTTVDGHLQIYDCRDLDCTYLNGASTGFTPEDDWILEAGTIDSLVFAKVWREGDSEPQHPAVIVENSTYPNGQFGVVAYIGNAWTQPAQVNATFDDIKFTPLSTEIEGDYNANGIVDQGDLDVVLINWGRRGGLSYLLASGWYSDRPSGIVDQDDLDRVLVNWGSTTAGAGAASIPEPSALVLAIVTGVAGVLARYRPWRHPSSR